MGGSIKWMAFGFLGMILLPPGPAPALDDEEDEESGESPKPGSKRSRAPSEHEQRILKLFSATSASFEDGRIVLVYDFERQDDALVVDWSPAVDRSMKSRLHWTSQGEMDLLTERGYGYTTSRTRSEPEGVILADQGQWVHKAVFLRDVQVEVDLLNIAHPRPGTILGPVFVSEQKKKQAIGVNSGSQAVFLNGLKPKKTPHPKTEKAIPWKTRHSFGLKYDGKVVESWLDGKKLSDTSSVAGFAEGIEAGRAGLAWNGSVKAYVYSVTVTGRLDPDWVSKQLAEADDPAAKRGSGGPGNEGRESKAKGAPEK